MSIEKIYNMSKGGGKIYDKQKPAFSKDKEDIRNIDPGLCYIGDDGREYNTISELEAANRRYFNEYFPIIEEKPTSGRR